MIIVPQRLLVGQDWELHWAVSGAMILLPCLDGEVEGEGRKTRFQD